MRFPTRACCFVAFLAFLSFSHASAAGLEVSYQIDARLIPDRRLLVEDIRISVSSDVPLRDLEMLMFPEQLNAQRTQLDDLTFPRVYPGAFSPAHLTFAPRQDGETLEVIALPTPPGWESGTLVSIRLATPSTPGRPLVIEGPFSLEIPRRYGVFGAIHSRITLSGGWYPVALAHNGSSWDPLMHPPIVAVALTMRYPAGFVALLAGSLMPLVPCNHPPEERRRDAEQCSSLQVQSRFPGLEVGLMRAFPLNAEIPLTLYDSVDRPAERRVLEQLVQRALVTWKEAGLPTPEAPGPLVRAPMRRALAMAGEREVLLSDRALRVFAPVRRLHEISLIHTLYQSWLMALHRNQEPAEDLGWVCSGLAWQLVLEHRTTLVSREFEVEALVRRLSILPAFDQMLHAPQFAFAGEIFERPYGFDPIRETVVGLIHPVSSGRVMFMKLEDRFSVELVQRVSRSLLEGGTESFVSALAQRSHVTPADLRRQIDEWERPYPQVNYVLDQVRRVRKGSKLETSFTVSTELSEHPAPSEPVTIEVITRDSGQKLSWRSGSSAHLTVVTDQPVKQIVLDPEQRLLEINDAGVVLRGDNYWPRRRKVLLSLIGGRFDLSVRKPQIDLALFLTNPHDRDWMGLLEAYSDSQVTLGSSLGVFRYLGPYRDSQWRVHRIGAQVMVGHRAGATFAVGDTTGQFLDTFGLRATYRFETRQSRLDPRRGIYLNAGVEEGLAHTSLGVHPYTLVSLGAIKPVALHPRHVLVGRMQFDAGLGLDRSLGVGLFTLGGGSELRALSTDAAAGNLRWLTSLEYRALVFQGLDIDLRAVRVHGLQGVIFADVGKVGNQWSDLSHPFVGYGVGLRVFGDIAGVLPAMIGLDLARTADGQLRPILQLSQPF